MTFWQLVVALFHPLDGAGYQMWSGILGSFVVAGGLWAGVAHAVVRHNCHVHRCPRVGRFHHPDGYLACKRHMPKDLIPGMDLREATLRRIPGRG